MVALTYKISIKEKNKLHINNENSFLLSIYEKSKDEINGLKDLFSRLRSDYDLDDKEILNLIREDLIFIPVSIFSGSLAPLEAVVYYLKEDGYSFHKIASLLNRNDRTIWVTYNKSLKKKFKEESTSNLMIPLSILKNRRFSILESITFYLKEEKKLSLRQISTILNKNPKTIWTVYSRFKKKDER